MPKKTARELASHLTQAYREWDGSDKQYLQSDVRLVEGLYYALQEHLEKEKGSSVLNELYEDVSKLRSGLRENARQIDEEGMKGKALDDKQEELGIMAGNVVNGLRNLKGKEASAFKKHLDRFNELNPVKASKIIKMSGEVKPASEFIDKLKKDAKDLKLWENGTLRAKTEYAAQVFAARQLANAKFGKRANIDNNRISEAELKNQTAKLMADPEFQEYCKNVLPTVDKKTFEHGHGGLLEKNFEEFLAKNPKAEPREFDLTGRYKTAIHTSMKEWVDVDYEMAGVQDPRAPKVVPEQNYKDYSDYIKKTAGKPFVGSKIGQAAKMAAANELSRKKPEAPFDKKALQKKTQEFLKDKNFKIMVSDPENVNKLLKGDFVGFAEEVGSIKTSCEAMLDDNGQLEINGYPTLSLDRLEKRAEKNPDLKPVIESVDKILPGDDKNAKITAEDVMNAVGTIVDYQNKHASDHLGEIARDLSDTMRLLHELTKGRYINHVVDDQMKMINGMRDYEPDHPSYMSRKLIEAEGIAEEKQARLDLGLDKKPEAVEEAEPEAEGPEELNQGFNYGHKAHTV